LDKVDPELFGLAIVTTDVKIFTEGNINNEVSIQSISKVFTMAKVIEDSGSEEVLQKVGVEATGMAFNSIIAIELHQGKEINPLVNPRAIATTSLIKGNNYDEKWNLIKTTFAYGGTNPITKKKVVSYQTVAHVIPVMATAGLYDDTGQWIYNVGQPGKSGVGGGIIAFYPGQFGIAKISPQLDTAGNSVRAQESIKNIVAELGSNPFYVQPGN
jgi:glutaminase